ncbi:hypothetical protein JMF89_01930 [Clostridiaceae bacterium UIB06]|uniref:Flagellar hook-length control protein FliK n=1 Tax=Clostridium thailandense TaxID=2794346 RepID=A0A949TUL3_9CLOT|nr:hypothetical protein [Clostridium thailandense]MCH5135971.1 hypothetical protein [Clostridiaceae bacterium UIB06]
MAGIWNINSVYNANTKMVSRKLSFEVGQNFAARVVNLDKLTGEILLKLLDGWQFSAKLENPIENLPDGLVRFVVDGFEDGKLQLKIVNTNSKQQSIEKDSVNAFLKENNMMLNDSDYEILNKMVKHNIPLTKENISEVKTMTDFMSKIKLDTGEEDAFIEKYIQSKNIDTQSKEGVQVKNTLKSFFNELKNLTEDDLFILFENNIDLTEENIKSFNNVFKGDSAILRDVKYIGDEFKNIEYEDGKLDNIATENGDFNNVITANDKKVLEKEQLGNKNTTENNKTLEKAKINNKKIADNQDGNLNIDKEVLTKQDDKTDTSKPKIINEKGVVEKENLDNNIKNSQESSKISNEKNSNLVEELKTNSGLKDKNVLVDKQNEIEDIANNIKEQINIKTEELKDTVKTFLEQKSDLDPKIYNNVLQALDKNINDFKVFNSISNQYYYLDLPINLQKQEYQCKLMIKDDRKKGKKIDSTDVKIAASVNTVNMGVVDAYIKVNNYNMNLDIKCNEQWIKVLDKGKEIILSKLSDMGYNVYANVSERKKEMNITNCSDFFDDNNLNAIDKKV